MIDGFDVTLLDGVLVPTYTVKDYRDWTYSGIYWDAVWQFFIEPNYPFFKDKWDLTEVELEFDLKYRFEQFGTHWWDIHNLGRDPTREEVIDYLEQMYLRINELIKESEYKLEELNRKIIFFDEKSQRGVTVTYDKYGKNSLRYLSPTFCPEIEVIRFLKPFIQDAKLMRDYIKKGLIELNTEIIVEYEDNIEPNLEKENLKLQQIIDSKLITDISEHGNLKAIHKSFEECRNSGLLIRIFDEELWESKNIKKIKKIRTFINGIEQPKNLFTEKVKNFYSKNIPIDKVCQKSENFIKLKEELIEKYKDRLLSKQELRDLIIKKLKEKITQHCEELKDYHMDYAKKYYSEKVNKYINNPDKNKSFNYLDLTYAEKIKRYISIQKWNDTRENLGILDNKVKEIINNEKKKHIYKNFDDWWTCVRFQYFYSLDPNSHKDFELICRNIIWNHVDNFDPSLIIYVHKNQMDIKFKNNIYEFLKVKKRG